MHYNILWTSDLKVSKICLGTMTRWFQNTESDAHEQLDYAIHHGINMIDTAELYAVPPSPETYGLTETYIGNWLHKRFQRQDIVIASKVAGPWISHIRDGIGLTKESILSAVDASLKRLQTDYIDLYQIHRPQRKVPLRGKANFDESMTWEKQHILDNIYEIYNALYTLVQSWKVRYVWLSNETARGVMSYLDIASQYDFPRIHTIQNAYSIVRREYESSLEELCLYENISLLAYSPLARGVLSWKYLYPGNERWTLDEDWWRDRYGYYLNNRVVETLHHLQTIAEEMKCSLTQLALAFVHNRSFVGSTIVGCRSIDQLRECIDSSLVTLSPSLYQRIDEISRQYPNPVLF